MQTSGGADQDRTDDLLNANQALSQLSYSPRMEWFFDLISLTFPPPLRIQESQTDLIVLEASWMSGSALYGCAA